MSKFILTFLLLYFPLLHFSETKIESLKNLKPSPKKIPIVFTDHGIERVDNYYWMRDDTRSDIEVINYLKSENDYANKWFSSMQDNKSKIVDSLKIIQILRIILTYFST